LLVLLASSVTAFIERRDLLLVLEAFEVSLMQFALSVISAIRITSAGASTAARPTPTVGEIAGGGFNRW
jgi:hypothetical protein